jgi:ribonuclease J
MAQKKDIHGIKHIKNPSSSSRKRIERLKIIPLGGLEEVGRNMTIFEYKRKILIVDVGFGFPGENAPGIDYTIPNTEYLEGRKKDIVGILFTHGHLDHIGALPYVLEKIYRKDLKIFASPVTKKIILNRQAEFTKQPKIKITEVKDGFKTDLDPFKAEFFRQNHNIPGNLGIIINTPIGNIVTTSDFKFDEDPLNDKPTDFKKLKKIGKRGIHLLCCDSTGAEEEGHSLSEKEIKKNLKKIFKKTKGRIIVSTFSSLLNRIQQVVDLSRQFNRKIAVEGYSMQTKLDFAKNLGYIKAKKDRFISSKQAQELPDDQVTILCTGTQGEANAALSRIVAGRDKYIKFRERDTVIFSSSVIPGNAKLVQALKDKILKKGVSVYHYEMMDIHASGHGKKEELKKMIELMNPKFFMPIHGQVSMLYANAELAKEAGVKPENIILAENGNIINLTKTQFAIDKRKVPSEVVMVDGLGVGDVGKIVLRDRHSLAEDGMFVIIITVDKKTGEIIKSPDIISRGFVYLKESRELLKESRQKAIQIVKDIMNNGGNINWNNVKSEIRKRIGQSLYSRTQRRPMVLPVIIEV